MKADMKLIINPNETDKTYVSFLIYDLPGKEDLFRTYVEPSIGDSVNPDVQKRIFRDIVGDNPKAKERKSTYVLNPMLLPAFDNNTNIMWII